MSRSAASNAIADSAPAGAEARAGERKMRFTGIDAMRGIAAMAVVLHHLMLAVDDKNGEVIHWMSVLGEYGRFGVEVFFVLSGFVIAHSTRDGDYSFGYLGRFAARRAIRLDVPYWATIFLEVMLLAATAYLLPQLAHGMPSLAQVLSNMFYAQTFLGYAHILPIFWTLCYEVQFYLVFVLALIGLQRLDVWVAFASWKRIATALLLIASFLLSLFIFASRSTLPVDGLFIDRWFQFLLGVFTYLYVCRRLHAAGLAAALSLCALAALFSGDAYRAVSICVCCATALVIVASVRWQAVQRLSESVVLQWLGLMSYSIYLLHLSIGWRAVVAFKMLVPIAGAPLRAVAALCTGILVTLIGAWLMHLVLEAPALKLAHRVKLPRRHSSAHAVPDTPPARQSPART